jgi:hypothetical protein
MKLSIHIDRLIVDGLELSHPERRELLDAVRDGLRELLIVDAGTADASAAPAAADRTVAPTRAGRLGREVAAGIHRAMMPLPMPADRILRAPPSRSGPR